MGALEAAYVHGVDPGLILKYEGLVDSLSVDAVQGAAQYCFDLDNYVRAVLYPEAHKK